MTDRETASEYGILAAIVYGGDDYFAMVRDRVPREAFQMQLSREVFDAACALQDRGIHLDPVVVLQEAQKRGSRITGETLHELEVYAIERHNIQVHIQILLTNYRSVKLRNMLSEAMNALVERNEPDSVAADLAARLEDLNKDVETAIIENTEAVTMLAKHRDRLESGAYDAYVPTGYPNLDEAFGGGLIRGGFYIAAARPGVGKTALALAIAERVCRQYEKRVMFVSLEMRPTELMAREAAMISGIPSTEILVQRNLGDRNAALFEAFNKLEFAGPSYNRKNRLSVSDIGFMARRSKAQLLIIDYLGLIQERDGKDRYEKTTNISNRLKELAMDLNIPIFCLAQLNRQATATEEPKLSDLRDSGALEQDADGILMMYRPEEAAEGEETILAGTVAKNRHGRGGARIEFRYDPKTNRIGALMAQARAPVNITVNDDEEIPF